MKSIKNLLKLTPPIEIDMGLMDFLEALACCFPAVESHQQKNHLKIWPSEEAITALSVRTVFDSLLSVLKLPAGSHVLMSGLSIPAMEQIVRAHHLIPIPIDIDTNNHQIKMTDLIKKTSQHAKLIVVAHLFGPYNDLSTVANFAKANGLILVEDCAQSFDGLYRGSPYSDVSMFSFGPIKRYNALCGCRIVVRNSTLQNSLRAHLQQLKPLPASWWVKRVLKYSVVKVISSSPIYGPLRGVLGSFVEEPDRFLYRMTQSFGNSSSLDPIRQKIGGGALRYLMRRLNEERVLPSREKYWVRPLKIHEPGKIVAHLLRNGIGASSFSANLHAVSAPPGFGDNLGVEGVLANTVFVNVRHSDQEIEALLRYL